MIPKTIHYCWFGRNPKPRLVEKCIKSWKKHCPGYEIIEWNENNFDVFTCPLYVRQAYEAKKWAFVSDVARIYALKEHGGIYFDTDIVMVQDIDDLLENDAFVGFENKDMPFTAVFGAKKKHPFCKKPLPWHQTGPVHIPAVPGHRNARERKRR